MYFAVKYHCVVPETWLSFSQVLNRKGHIMFSKGIKHTALAAAFTVFSATSFSWITTTESTNPNCSCPSQMQANNANYLPVGNCQARAANQSWLSWLTGKSRSSQFHYLDLLELLESGKKEANTNYTSHIR